MRQTEEGGGKETVQLLVLPVCLGGKGNLYASSARPVVVGDALLTAGHSLCATLGGRRAVPANILAL